jgi:uncharacterized protein
MIESLVIGGTLGLAASAHCVAMCGPLVAGGCTKDGAVRPRLALDYALGRILGYATLGGIAATLGRPFVGSSVARGAQVAAAAGVAIVLVLTAIRWLRPTRSPTGPPLAQLRTPTRRWRILDKLPRRGLGLGLATSLFPCGALASGVLAAAVSGSWPAGMLIMTAFAIASQPALGVVVFFGDRVMRLLRTSTSGPLRILAGTALLGVALWIGLAPWMRGTPAKASDAQPHTCCHPHE